MSEAVDRYRSFATTTKLGPQAKLITVQADAAIAELEGQLEHALEAVKSATDHSYAVQAERDRLRSCLEETEDAKTEMRKERDALKVIAADCGTCLHVHLLSGDEPCCRCDIDTYSCWEARQP